MASEDYSDLIAAAKDAPSKAEDYSDLIAAAKTQEPEEGGPESFLHPDKFKPSPQHRKLKNTGPIEQVRAEMDPKQYWVPKDIGEATAAPILSMADRASFGGLGGTLRASQRINAAAGRDSEIPDRSLEAMEGFRRTYPTLSRYTDLPAFFTKGYATLAEGLGKVGAQVGKFASAGNPLADLARVGIPAAGLSGIPAATETLSEGGDSGEAANALLAGGKAGLEIGVPLAGAARLAGGASRAITESRGGQARRFIEERGGPGVEVGPLTPGSGGKFDEMVTHGHDDAAIGAQAEASAREGLGQLNQEHKGVRAALGLRKGNVAKTPDAGRLHDVTDVVTKLNESLDDLDLSEYAEQKLERALKKIHKAQGAGFNPETDNYMLNETDLNKLRVRLDKAAKTGESTAGDLQPLREAANHVRSLVNQGPYADVNKQFAEEYSRNKENRTLLGIKPKSKTPDEPNSAFNTVSNLLKRRGKNEVTGGGEQGRVAKFAERNPAIEEEFVKPELLRKRADIGFHVFPQHGGLYERLGPGAHYMAHALGHLSTGVLPALALTNRNAIAARLLYGPALAAQAAEPLLLNEIPLLAAARNSQEQR